MIVAATACTCRLRYRLTPSAQGVDLLRTQISLFDDRASGRSKVVGRHRLQAGLGVRIVERVCEAFRVVPCPSEPSKTCRTCRGQIADLPNRRYEDVYMFGRVVSRVGAELMSSTRLISR